MKADDFSSEEELINSFIFDTPTPKGTLLGVPIEELQADPPVTSAWDWPDMYQREFYDKQRLERMPHVTLLMEEEYMRHQGYAHHDYCSMVLHASGQIAAILQGRPPTRAFLTYGCCPVGEIDYGLAAARLTWKILNPKEDPWRKQKEIAQWLQNWHVDSYMDQATAYLFAGFVFPDKDYAARDVLSELYLRNKIGEAANTMPTVCAEVVKRFLGAKEGLVALTAEAKEILLFGEGYLLENLQ